MNLTDKHILVITSVYPLTKEGRDGAFVRETVVRLLASQAKFTIFAPAYEASKNQILDGCQVYRFRYCLKPWENLVRDGAPSKLEKQPLYFIVAALYILLGTWQLLLVCAREKPDLLWVNWPFPHGLMAWPTSKILKIPMVFTCHGTEILLSKKFGFIKKILAWLLPQTKGVTANSHFTEKLITAIREVPVTIIPYGITIEPKPAKNWSSQGTVTILFVGRLIERKGLRYLLEAMPLVLKETPVQLRVVGKGDREADFQLLVQELGLETQVSFLGFLRAEELAQEYATCDLFILPSIVDNQGETEGLGIVLIEALAHAKPVIATALGGITDIIRDGETGLLVPQKEPQAIAEAILKIIAEPEKAATMGKKGCRDIQERFNWNQIIPQWLNLFNSALSNS